MRKSKFRMFVEGFIGVIVCLMFGFFLYVIATGGLNDSGDVTFGINGITESRCIGGFKHSLGAGGVPIQIIGVNGGGIPCN